MRRLALLIVLLVGVVPGQAAADLGTPLRTLCLSSMMDYCASIYTWSWEYRDPGEVPPNGRASVGFNTTVEFFGAGLLDGPWREFGLMAESDGDDFYTFVRPDMPGGPDQLVPGVYDLEQGGASRLVDWVPEVDKQVRWVHWIGQDGRRWCDAQSTAAEGGCYEVSVPEPTTAALLLTGLLGMAWRRRRMPNS